MLYLSLLRFPWPSVNVLFALYVLCHYAVYLLTFFLLFIFPTFIFFIFLRYTFLHSFILYFVSSSPLLLSTHFLLSTVRSLPVPYRSSTYLPLFFFPFSSPISYCTLLSLPPAPCTSHSLPFTLCLSRRVQQIMGCLDRSLSYDIVHLHNFQGTLHHKSLMLTSLLLSFFLLYSCLLFCSLTSQLFCSVSCCSLLLLLPLLSLSFTSRSLSLLSLSLIRLISPMLSIMGCF